MIESITGRVRTTDEVKQDEAMSRRIKEGVVKENQHNLENMAVSNTLGDVTNTPTKPSAKATPASAPTPEKRLTFDEDNHVVTYEPPVFSTIPNNKLQDLRISAGGTFPYKDGVESSKYSINLPLVVLLLRHYANVRMLNLLLFQELETPRRQRNPRRRRVQLLQRRESVLSPPSLVGQVE